MAPTPRLVRLLIPGLLVAAIPIFHPGAWPLFGLYLLAVVAMASVDAVALSFALVIIIGVLYLLGIIEPNG